MAAMTIPNPPAPAPGLPKLPFRATLAQSLEWMAAQTGTPWTLARLVEHDITPYVWLDYDAAYPDLFGEANGGYAAPIFYEGDIARLLAGGDDVLITMTKDAYKIVARLPAPGFTRQRHELRFLGKELERLVGRLKHAAAAPPPKVATAQESKAGINAAQVLAAFGPLVRIDLQQALLDAGGVFGDEGARVKGSAKKGKANTVWNPITLALGLNDVYRVPVGALRRTFVAHDFLHEWQYEWDQTLALLGK
jgi:hypothetical protein